MESKQPRQIEIFYSYACRDTYEVFEWLRRAQSEGVALDITWRPYAIQMGDDAGYWRRPWSEASSELRGFIVAEAVRRQSQEAFHRFHAALEAAVHEELLELAEEAVLLGAVENADVDVAPIRTAFEAPAEYARTAERSHQRAEAEYDIFGTPTLVFPNDQTLHVELDAIPPVEEARALFDHVAALAVKQPYVSRLERTTPAPERVST